MVSNVGRGDGQDSVFGVNQQKYFTSSSTINPGIDESSTTGDELQTSIRNAIGKLKTSESGDKWFLGRGIS